MAQSLRFPASVSTHGLVREPGTPFRVLVKQTKRTKARSWQTAYEDGLTDFPAVLVGGTKFRAAVLAQPLLSAVGMSLASVGVMDTAMTSGCEPTPRQRAPRSATPTHALPEKKTLPWLGSGEVLVEDDELRSLFYDLTSESVTVLVRSNVLCDPEEGWELHQVFRKLLERKVFGVQLVWEDSRGRHTDTLFCTQLGIFLTHTAAPW